MARISGLSRATVYAGVRELDQPPDPGGRVRRPDGGAKRLVALVRAGARFEAGKLVERPDETPDKEAGEEIDKVAA